MCAHASLGGRGAGRDLEDPISPEPNFTRDCHPKRMTYLRTAKMQALSKRMDLNKEDQISKDRFAELDARCNEIPATPVGKRTVRRAGG